MADEENNDAENQQSEDVSTEEEQGDEQSNQGDGSSKKKLILIVIPVIVLLLGGAGLYFSGILGGMSSEKPAEATEAEGDDAAAATDAEKTETSGEKTEGGETAEGEAAAPTIPPKNVYFDLPDILVNLNSGNKKQVYLKVLITLSLPDAETSTIVENEMPRILDSFQIYLRELTVDEIQASSGMYRLKEELIGRINRVISPARINDVLFKEMLIQ